VFGCESKLDSTIPSYSIFPDSYTIHRLDRSQHGGGVFISAKHDLITIDETDHRSTNCELIWVSIQFSRTEKLHIGSYYRPPDSGTDPIEALDDSLSFLYSGKRTLPQVILCGDFNCGYID